MFGNADFTLVSTLQTLLAAAVGLLLALLLWRRQALRLRLESKLWIAVHRDPAQRTSVGGDG